MGKSAENYQEEKQGLQKLKHYATRSQSFIVIVCFYLNFPKIKHIKLGI